MAYSFKSNIHRAASLYYDNLSPGFQSILLQRFRSMDADGNGSISQAELLQTCRESTDPTLSAMVSCLPKLFSLLDMDGTGVLDFNECKCVFFLVSTSTICGHCGDIILDNFAYTCKDCWDLHEANFDLCLKCYPAKVHTHHHRNFLPQKLIINLTLGDRLKQVQCVTCGDFHMKDIRGVLLGTHMVRNPDSGVQVCEWCAAWSCTACGKFFVDSSNPSPRRWLLNKLFCKGCGSAGNKTNVEPVIKLVKESNVVRSCSTCKIKANNGTLWEAGSTSTSTSAVMISEYVDDDRSSLAGTALVPYINAASATAGLVSNIVTAITSCSIL